MAEIQQHIIIEKTGNNIGENTMTLRVYDKGGRPDLKVGIDTAAEHQVLICDHCGKAGQMEERNPWMPQGWVNGTKLAGNEPLTHFCSQEHSNQNGIERRNMQ